MGMALMLMPRACDAMVVRTACLFIFVSGMGHGKMDMAKPEQVARILRKLASSMLLGGLTTHACVHVHPQPGVRRRGWGNGEEIDTAGCKMQEILADQSVTQPSRLSLLQASFQPT